MFNTLFSLSTLALSLPLVNSLPTLEPRQAPNTIYAQNPLSQTASLNATFFVVPIPKSEALKMTKGRKLLPPRGLPQGFLKDDEHPYVLTVGLFHDIRQATLEIPNLSFANAQIPFVDGSGDGQTPFTFNTVSYQNEPVPVIVGGLGQGTALVLANFDPKDAASKRLNNDEQSFDVAVGLRNTLLGLPTPNSPVLTAVWKEAQSDVNPQFFKGVLEAPYVHTFFGTCTTIRYVFDESFADPYTVRASTLQTYFPTTPTYHDYSNIPGFHITVEWDAPAGPGTSCKSADQLAAARRARYE